MRGLKKVLKKGLGEMNFNMGGGSINWFPGHMAAATRAIRDRLKVSDLVIEVRDARIPLSSANEDLQSMLHGKRRIIALNKKDLANPNIMPKWIRHFESCNQDCITINAHSTSSVNKLVELVELKLKEVISREPTLLVMVVGVPNVGKSALINNVHKIAATRFPAQDKLKRATVGPLPGVTQDIAGYKIAHKPSIYVLDTPGVLVPSIPDIETGLKLALSGSVKDSVVGEERIAQYLLALLNTRGTPLHWRNMGRRLRESPSGETAKPIYNVKDLLKPKRGTPLHWRNMGRRLRESPSGETAKPIYNVKDLLKPKRKPLDQTDVYYVEDIVMKVQNTLNTSLTEFDGDLEDEADLEILIERQFDELQSSLKIGPQRTASEARTMVAKKLITLFRSGKLGPFILDDVP